MRDIARRLQCLERQASGPVRMVPHGPSETPDQAAERWHRDNPGISVGTLIVVNTGIDHRPWRWE